MGWLRTLFGADPVVNLAAEVGPTFADPVVDWDALGGPQFFGYSAAPLGPSPRVDRRSAIQVPAVKRSRDLIAGTLGGLPLDLIGPDKSEPNRPLSTSSLFAQPERNVPRSVTMAKTFEDLFFEGIAWWQVVARGWDNFPTFVRRVDPAKVSISDGRVYIDGQPVPDLDVIRFDSPTDALLIAGARAIRTCLLLDGAAQRYADEPMPSGYFAPVEGIDPDPVEVQELLNDWRLARQARVTGYVPAALKYQTVAFSPEQLQMADARQHAVLEIARLAGVDAEELGVSTTSRTYANQQDRRKAFLDFTLGQFRQAVEDRLSMTDVSPRGYVAKFNLSAFLRSDDLTRMQTYEIAERVGALTRPEIRELEDRPALAASSEADDAQGPPALRVVASSDPAAITFDQDETTVLEADTSATFAVDTEARTITGLAVPYGRPARSRGVLYQFARGSLKYGDLSRIKLLLNHDFAQAVGYVTDLQERDEGLFATFKVARGPEGDKALTLAEDKVLDGLSIGLGTGGKFATRAGVQHAISAPLAEVSLTPIPAFDDARVLAVAASADRGDTMTDTTEETTEAAAPVDFAAMTEALSGAVTGAIGAGFASLDLPKPEAVSPTEPVVTHEPAPYRFDGGKAEHDFSTDLIAYGRDHDSEAGTRLLKFMDEAFGPRFDVDTADVTSVNPVRQRPEMYVDGRRFTTPFYSALYSGALSDATPFVVPKFNSATGLVADHTQGVEPTPGAFTATSQTVTPSAVSGKVEITREVWDQGGNPQVSGLIWNRMVYEYYKALEAKAVAVLTANAANITDIALTTGATDDDLVGELEAAIADLQFIAGGNTFNFAGTHVDLYKRLAAAVDGTGRKLLPILGPTNAAGQARSKYASLDVAGVEFAPAWSAGAASSGPSNSWLVDTQSVHVWNSTPQRLQFEYRVAYIDLAIWGYVAAAVTDLNGVRQITYDPTV